MDDLIDLARTLSLDDFRARHSCPFLVGEAREPLDEGQVFTTASGETPISRFDAAYPEALAPARITSVHPLVKGVGNPFATMITVGRAANNDVQLECPTVSKFHAFFRVAGAGWELCDAGSANGTFLRLRRLEPRVVATVAPGDDVAFGREARFRFVDAAALWDVLRAIAVPLRRVA